DSERPITAGSVDLVPLDTFYGVDYVALGHVHGRATLAHHIRYPGAALHYSFSEAGKLRGGWLVELGADGLAGVTWAPFPVPRPLVVLTDELERVLSSENLERFRDHWVSAVLTDRVRPADAMRRLQERFPWCASVEHRPAGVKPDHPGSYAVRVRGKSDDQLLGAFLEHVRNGIGPTPAEADMFREVVDGHRAQEAVR
ncbi:MAG: exonuclease SbcCD subunit D, partial [Solirubrobacteraceae bacterium]